MAFWAVSNCDTPIHREQYVKKLQEYTKIDIFSNKGCLISKKNYTCPLEKSPVHNHNNPVFSKCFQKITEQYWFYLAFENSICNDYITEKFWRTLDLKTVPVVMGGGNYSRDAPEKVVCSYPVFQNFRIANQFNSDSNRNS